MDQARLLRRSTDPGAVRLSAGLCLIGQVKCCHCGHIEMLISPPIGQLAPTWFEAYECAACEQLTACTAAMPVWFDANTCPEFLALVLFNRERKRLCVAADDPYDLTDH